MSDSSDAKKQVRLDKDVYEHLIVVKAACEWPVSLQVLVNYAVRRSLGTLKRTFNSKNAKI